MFASKDLFFTRPSGYQISRSVRLRSSASANFSRTFAANPTVRTKFHLHWIVKRGSLGTDQRMFSGYGGASGDSTFIIFNSNNNLFFNVGGSNGALTSNAVFRDPSAWYIFDLAFDSTAATAANRAILWVNGVQQTWASGTVTLNGNPEVALANGNNKIGSNWDNTLYFDGYFTEFYFIDGQALTPSSFGETNALTGVWQPKKYAGTYGTNGFYLNFNDNSAATAAAIGKDYSGNGNNWTPSAGISITAGVTYDSMLDVPTPYADGGNGRGNYCVFNPVNVSGGGTTTITNGNLATTPGSTTTFGKVLGTFGMTTGKWYWETTITAVGSAASLGIGDGTPPSGSFGLGGVAGELAYGSTGVKYTNNTSTAYGATFTTGDVIGAAYDADAGSITFYKNNVSQGAITGFSGTKYPAVASSGGTNPSYTVNFGQRPFTYTPPTGFVALNTQNLPAPTISNGANYMAATLYTGTGASLTIANTVGSASFQPDWVWVKSRSAATDHALYDSVRGVQKQLESNTTTAETTETTGLTAFGTTGFTIGALAQMNTSAATYVGWQWNAGGSTVTNTSGSISAQVRANTTAGFSVATFTAPASGAFTVGHGLGVAPAMVIMKPRNNSADSWVVYHKKSNATPQSYYLLLNSTAAAANSTTIFNNTAPTSTVVSYTSAVALSASATAVMYSFAEVAGYSAFGSYTGNGSADGPFVYLGFRPRFIMFKRTDAVASWRIIDTAREPINATQTEIYPNLANAEGSAANGMDILSNGFKLRASYAEWNTSGGTYIYACFAENPFKNSLAR